ncbi:MAG: hypothetical protein WAV67_13415, partial [Dokdonella sp.]
MTSGIAEHQHRARDSSGFIGPRVRVVFLLFFAVAGAHARAAITSPGITERALNTVLVRNYDVDDGLPQ